MKMKKRRDRIGERLVRVTPKHGAVAEIYLFGSKSLNDAKKKFGWKRRGKNLLDRKGEQIRCGCCNKKITEKNVAAFFPAPKKVSCVNPDCFWGMVELAERLEKQNRPKSPLDKIVNKLKQLYSLWKIRDSLWANMDCYWHLKGWRYE